jgi:hypothetical protein
MCSFHRLPNPRNKHVAHKENTVMKRMLILGTLTLASLGGVTAAAAEPVANTVHQQKAAGPYRITLQIGPAEMMSTHPKGNSGERMLSGMMASCSMPDSGMGGMSMGSKTCNRHIEVRVDNRRTGKVVSNAHVQIRLINQRTLSVITVPIMTMVGARQGIADLHYGNNIYGPNGAYTVVTRINGTSASFGVNLR